MWRILLSFVFQFFLLALCAVAPAQTISHVRMTPMDVPVGGSSLVYVTLTDVPASDVTVLITRNREGVVSPNRLTFPKGKVRLAFTIKTLSNFSGSTFTFKAPGNSVTKTLLRDSSIDWLDRTEERVSAGPAYQAGNLPSEEPVDQPAGDRRALSADGLRVVFSSRATNLVVGDTNRRSDVFLRDAVQGRTIRLSNGLGGKPANGRSFHPSISGNGTYAVFVSEASNLVPNDTNSAADVFLVRLSDLATTRISTSAVGLEGNDDSGQPSINADGSFVAFASYASNLMFDDMNGFADVFVWARASGSINRVSVSRTGAEANGESYAPSIGRDGTKISFTSTATNLIVNDLNEQADIFLRDRTLQTNTLISVDEKGLPLRLECITSSLADNGNRVAFVAADFVREGNFGKRLRVYDSSTRRTRFVDPPDANRSIQSFALSENGRYLAAVDVSRWGWSTTSEWNPTGRASIYDLYWSAVPGLPFNSSPRVIYGNPNYSISDVGITPAGDWLSYSSGISLDPQDTNYASDIAVSTAIYPVAHFYFPITPMIKGETAEGRVVLSGVSPAGGTTVTLRSYEWEGTDRTVVIPEGESASAPVPFTVRKDAEYSIAVSALRGDRTREIGVVVLPVAAYSDKTEYPKGTKYVRIWADMRSISTQDRSFRIWHYIPASVPHRLPSTVVIKAGQRRASFIATFESATPGDYTVTLLDSSNDGASARFTILK